MSGAEPKQSGPKSRMSGERESKKRADRSGARSRRSRSGERRSQKWALTRAEKQRAALRSNAPDTEISGHRSVLIVCVQRRQ